MAWHLHVTRNFYTKDFQALRKYIELLKLSKKQKEKCVKYVEWEKVEA